MQFSPTSSHFIFEVRVNNSQPVHYLRFCMGVKFGLSN
jgi:hypothetical protein